MTAFLVVLLTAIIVLLMVWLAGEEFVDDPDFDPRICLVWHK